MTQSHTTCSLAERFSRIPYAQRHRILQDFTEDQCRELLYDWRGFWARPEQLSPHGDWDIWLVMAGRGFGKTRSGSEWVREAVRSGSRRIALVAETQKDLEEVMIEGDSGILAVCRPHERPEYRKKPVRLRFPNGAIALGYSASRPDQLRGPQFDIAWCDELAKWPHARKTWDQLQFALRLGEHPRQMITTTPRPIELLKSIISGKEGKIHMTRGNTAENYLHLPQTFLHKIHSRYAGTAIGRQELDGEIITEIPESLWSLDRIDALRLSQPPQSFLRLVISIDPAASSHALSNEHGIIVAAIAQNSHSLHEIPQHVAYVLEDASLRGSPLQWAHAAISLYDSYAADAIVVEVNQGGDMVAQTLRSIRPYLNIISVRASRGKHLRAEPISALYERGCVHHVGHFPELENQMSLMTSNGYVGDESPDRLDALVWALTELFSTPPDLSADLVPSFIVKHVV